MKLAKRKAVKHGKEKWEIDYGLVGGKRVRRLFATEADADKAMEKAKKDQKQLGDHWLRLTPQERDTVILTYDDIKKNGHTLPEVWAGFQTWKMEQNAKPAPVVSKPYQDVVAFWKKRKLDTGKDERYIDECVDLLMGLVKGRERVMFDSLSLNDLEQHFDKQSWGKSTKKSNLGRFSSLWQVAVDKGWAPVNIVDKMEPIGKLGHNPEILEHQKCIHLMAGTLSNENSKRVIGPIALGLFAGMRPEEITHPEFGWHCINLERGLIEIKKEVAKVGDHRWVHVHPTGMAWLKLAKKSGNPLPPINERRLVDSICEWAFIFHWPKDILRKTAATHLYHYFGSTHDVVKELGNSIRILLRHYVDLVDKTESAKHWLITPDLVREQMPLIVQDLAKLEQERKARQKPEITTSEALPERSASGNAKVAH